MAALKVTTFNDVVLLYFLFLVLFDYRIHNVFESRVALNPVLRGVRDVASAIISHEQSQLNRVCCFNRLDAVFSKDPIIK